MYEPNGNHKSKTYIQKIKRRKSNLMNIINHRCSQKESKRRRNRKTEKQPETKHNFNKKILPTITLNVNDLNIPIKRHRGT